MRDVRIGGELGHQRGMNGRIHVGRQISNAGVASRGGLRHNHIQYRTAHCHAQSNVAQQTAIALIRSVWRGNSIAGGQRATQSKQAVLCRSRVEQIVEADAIMRCAGQTISEIKTQAALIVGREFAKSEVEHSQRSLPRSRQRGGSSADLAMNDGAVVAAERHVLQKDIGASSRGKLARCKAEFLGCGIGTADVHLQRGDLRALRHQFNLAVAQRGLDDLTQIRKALAAGSGSKIRVAGN